MRRLAPFDRALGWALRLVPIACLVALGLLIPANIAARWAGLSVDWFDEVVTALFAWMVFVGAAALWRERLHFAIDLVPDLLRGSRGAVALNAAIALMGLAFAAALTWYGAVFVLRTTATTPMLALPQAWIYACIPLSGAVMTLYALRDLRAAARRPLPPAPEICDKAATSH